jgi:hypothetical protein
MAANKEKLTEGAQKLKQVVASVYSCQALISIDVDVCQLVMIATI